MLYKKVSKDEIEFKDTTDKKLRQQKGEKQVF